MVESEDENRARLVEATGCRARVRDVQAGHVEAELVRRPSEWRLVRNMASRC